MTSKMEGTGQIVVSPPITWKEVRSAQRPFTELGSMSREQRTQTITYRFQPVTGPFYNGGWCDVRDLRLEGTDTIVDTDEGELRKREFDTIGFDIDHEHFWDIEEALSDIITRFATTPDGTPRRFYGYLEVNGEGAADLWRVHVDNGNVVRTDATITFDHPYYNQDCE